MIEVIEFKNKYYPKFQSEGNASQFAIPFAKHLCKGTGIDVGCSKEEWSFPGSIIIEPAINGLHAMDIPYDNLDYIFSSHCLEHITNWVDVLDYWYSKLKSGGTLFLYLPDYTQEYWRPWNNRKHVNIFTADIIYDYLISKGFTKVFKTGTDLNNSFIVTGEKI